MVENGNMGEDDETTNGDGPAGSSSQPRRTPPPGNGSAAQGETLESLAQEIARTRTLIHGSRGGGHPWTDSVVDTAHRRLIHLRGSRNDLAVAEIRRGHDPVDVAARAHIDPADVARLLAVRLRTALDPTGDF